MLKFYHRDELPSSRMNLHMLRGQVCRIKWQLVWCSSELQWLKQNPGNCGRDPALAQCALLYQVSYWGTLF